MKLDKERKEKRAEEKKRDREADALDDENQNEQDDGADKWEEGKRERENLAIFNHKKASAHYLSAAVTVSKGQREFNDSAHTLTTANLTDPGKVPREVASEMFEQSQVEKVLYAKLEGFEFKDKTGISSSEVLAYLKSVISELSLFTFG